MPVTLPDLHSMNEPASPMPIPCRICGGELRPLFSGTVLGDVQAIYARCATCESLIAPDPHWLERAYSTEVVPDPDSGALQRCLFIHRCIRRMRHLRLLPRRFRSLDFGSGRGVLLRLLLDDGMDAWGFDPFPAPAFAKERILQEVPDGPFDLVTAIEVIEHTLDPLQTLNRLREALAPGGILLLSTELYDRALHGPDWIYLAPEHGQHITMFSARGLQAAAEATGLRWIMSLPWGDKAFIHILAHPENGISAWEQFRLRRRAEARERRAQRDRFA